MRKGGENMRKAINIFVLIIVFLAGYFMGVLTMQDRNASQVSIAMAAANDCSGFRISKCTYIPQNNTYAVSVDHSSKQMLCAHGSSWPPMWDPICSLTALLQ